MPPIIATNSLQAGIQSAISDFFRQEFPVYKEQQETLLHFLPFSSIRRADYGFKDRVPLPKPWPYGKPRTYQGWQDRKVTIGVYPFDLTQLWSGFDEDDDQLDGPSGIQKHVSSAMERYMQLADILYSEYLTNAAVYNYWGLQNAYDGVGLFSAVDGAGDDRYGVVGGNIYTGSTVGSTAHIISDIQGVKRRFLEFTEPVTGAPLIDPGKVDYNDMLFIIPTELEGKFNMIADQKTIYSEQAINTAQDNVLVGKVHYKVNQYLTDADNWFVLLKHKFWKPFLYRAPQDVKQFYADMSNSDMARERNNRASYSHIRCGLGVFAPFTIVKVNN